MGTERKNVVMKLLEIRGLRTSVGEKEILRGIDLSINKGEVHVIMGPNGAGKSTLAGTLIGNPVYEISRGDIFFEGERINEWKVDERARQGMFLSFQYPQEIPGLRLEDFLRSAKESISGEKQSVIGFHKILIQKMKELEMDEAYAGRHLNVGFSGGEKKKSEILQLALLNPKLAILDETDSGLDVDATKIVFEGVEKLKTKESSLLIITHYDKVLDYIKPDVVHIMIDGKIALSGGSKLVDEIQSEGFDRIRQDFYAREKEAGDSKVQHQ